MPEPYQPGELVRLREAYRTSAHYPASMRDGTPFHVREVTFPDRLMSTRSREETLRDGTMIVASVEHNGYTVWIHRIERVPEILDQELDNLLNF